MLCYHWPHWHGMCRNFGITDLVCKGGFRNKRDVYDWEGETLELDETQV